MNGGFTKGLIIGSIIGASIVMMNPDMVRGRNKRKMMRTGRDFLRKSGSLIGGIVEMFR